MVKRRIYITEEQLKGLLTNTSQGSEKKRENNAPYIVDPKFNLYAKSIIDSLFVRGQMPTTGEDGFPTVKKVFGVKNSDGSVARNVDALTAADMMMTKLKDKYDERQRKAFVKLILIKWYNGEIDKNGNIGIYYYK